MPAPRLDLDVDQLVREYEGGASVTLLSQRHGASDAAVRRALRRGGVTLRTRAEAQVLRAAQEDTEAKVARYAASGRALRGRPLAQEVLVGRAQRKEVSQSLVGRHEAELAAAFAEAGLQVRPQLAVGPYNLDVAVGDHLDIEIHTSRHSPHLIDRGAIQQRVDYLAEQGWRVVYLWCPDGFTVEDTQQAVSLAKILSAAPPDIRQHLVVRCHGQHATLGRPKANN